MDKLLHERFIIARLVAEEMAGLLDEAGKEQLESWKNASPRHAEEWDYLHQELGKCPSMSHQRRGRQAVDQAWKKMETLLRRRRQRIRLAKVLRYAAILVVPVALAIFIWTRNDEITPTSTPVQMTAISPGFHRAQLILDDGKQIALDSASRIKIEGEDGVNIHAQNNVLTYQGEAQVATNVKYNTLVIPRGGEYALQLADGTRVWLNAESSLRYPVTFSGDERRVEMTGEVYFEVARDEAHPFIVSVNDVEVEVLGTSFNISAYDAKVVTTLVTGRVKVCTPADSTLLQVNQQASWDGKRISVRQVEAKDYTLWRKGIFCFNDTRLEDIMDALARWYDVHVFFQNPRMKDDRYSVEIRRYEEIDTILRRMAETNRVKFSVNGRTVSVYE